MKHEIDLKAVLDRIEDVPEEQAKCALKGLLLIGRISPEMMQKTLDFAEYGRIQP